MVARFNQRQLVAPGTKASHVPTGLRGVLPTPFCSVPTWGHRGFLTQCLVASVAIKIQNVEIGGCYDINAEKSRKVPPSLTVLVGEERHLAVSRVLNGALHLPSGLSPARWPVQRTGWPVTPATRLASSETRRSQPWVHVGIAGAVLIPVPHQTRVFGGGVQATTAPDPPPR